MTSTLEQFVLNELALNDGETFTVEDFKFTPAPKKVQLIDNPDADGSALVDEANYGDAKFEFTIRVEPQPDMDTALEKLRELINKVQSCELTDYGAPLEWTPAGSTRTLTWYVLIGETIELPVTVTGDMAGWLMSTPSPVVKLKLTARPFGHDEEVVVSEATSSESPLQEVYLTTEGDVPAEATMTVTDEAEQDRRYLEWGLQVVESEEGNPALLLEADEDFEVEGYVGELAEQAGSHSTKVVKATLTPTATVLCSTGSIEHIGTHRVKLRVWVTSTGEEEDEDGSLLRIAYRQGPGTWTYRPWQQPAQVEQWMELDCGEAFLEEAVKGEQVSEIRIEGKIEETATICTSYTDTLTLMPTSRYGVARAPLSTNVATELKVRDPFNQEEGEATGKEAELGGTYETLPSSDATDFTISAGQLRRSAKSDSASTILEGRSIGVNKTFTDFIMQHDFSIATGGGVDGPQHGHILSYVDNEHYVLVLSWLEGKYLSVYKAEGSESVKSVGSVYNSAGQLSGTLKSHVQGETLNVYRGSVGSPQLLLTVTDSMIGTEGKAFLYDRQHSSTAERERAYDNFAVWGITESAEQSVICASGQSAEIRHDAEEREDSTGSDWAPVPLYRGSHFYLDPAGDSERINRLAVKVRRNDNVTEPDEGLTDKLSVEVKARERFLTP